MLVKKQKNKLEMMKDFVMLLRENSDKQNDVMDLTVSWQNSQKQQKQKIAITFLVINLFTLLRQVSCLFLSLLLQTYKFGLMTDFSIIKADIQPYLLT